MATFPTVNNRNVQYPNRFKHTRVLGTDEDGIVDLVPEPGTGQTGTELNSTFFQAIKTYIDDLIAALTDLFPVSIANGGTGGGTAAQARTNLGISTYSGMSIAEGTAGTATTLRVIRADYLKAVIQAVAPGGGGGSGKKYATKVIGNTTSGHTATDCDYLCNGTNDTAMFTNAFAAMSTIGGGTLVVLEGLYTVNQTVPLSSAPNPIEIVGYGAVIRSTNNGVLPDYSDPTLGCCLLFQYCNGITIRGLTFQMEHTLGLKKAIAIEQCDAVVVEDVVVANPDSGATPDETCAFALYNCFGPVINRCTVKGYHDYGVHVYLQGVGQATVSDCILVGRAWTGANVYGIQCIDTGYLTVRGCRFGEVSLGQPTFGIWNPGGSAMSYCRIIQNIFSVGIGPLTENGGAPVSIPGSVTTYGTYQSNNVFGINM